MLLPTVFRSLTIATAIAGVCSATAVASPLPSYATGEESIKGTISSVSGKYKILVRDERGFIDDVTLHDGTVINPTGLTLAPGQTVTILGRNAGSTFRANEIDTPYNKSSPVTYAYPYLIPDGYPADPSAYGYPAYPYAYGYGYPYYPGLYGSVGFFFGSGFYGRGYYGRGYHGHGYYGRGGYYGGHGGGYYGHGGGGYYGRGYVARGGYGHGFGGAVHVGGGHAHR